VEWLSADFLNGVGTVGLCVLIVFSLIFGKGLALQRELKHRDATIDWQRLTIEEQADQIRDLIRGTSVAAGALEKVSQAAEQIVDER
jgi:cell division protein FtsL